MSRFPLLFINGMDMKRNKARITGITGISRISLLLYNTDIQINRENCENGEIRVIHACIFISRLSHQ